MNLPQSPVWAISTVATTGPVGESRRISIWLPLAPPPEEALILTFFVSARFRLANLMVVPWLVEPMALPVFLAFVISPDSASMRR